MTTEKVIFGRKPDQEEWEETLLLTHAENYNLDKVIPRIEADGWIVRVATIDIDTPPDFAAIITTQPKPERAKYRIQNQDGTFLNAGTDEPSWFHLETARKTVNYSIGQRIVEHDGMNVLWEIL